jgi:hypothetical protein
MSYLSHAVEQRTRDQFRAEISKLGIAFLLFLSTLVLYILTLAPGPLGGDAGEFQTAASVWGLTHPTGYPLYMLLIKVWALLPIGTVAYRVNLLAAVLAACAIGLFYTALQTLIQHRLASALAALALAFSPLFWSQAIIAEKYALNMLLISGVLAGAVYWAQKPDLGRLNLLALAYGLSLTHHRTMILFVPGLVVFVLGVDPSVRKSRRNLQALLYLVLPLSLYVYLPLVRAWGQPLSNWWPSTPGEWLTYLFALGHMCEPASANLPLADRLAVYGQALETQFAVWGLLLAGAGVVYLLRHRRPMAHLTLVSFGLLGFASMAYYLDPRNQNHFLSSFLIVAFWIGSGASAVLRWTGRMLRSRQKAKSLVVASVGLGLCLLPASLLLRSYPELYRQNHQEQPLDIWRQDLNQAQDASRFALAALGQAAPEGVVVCDWEQASLFHYFQQVEACRADVEVIYPIGRLEEVASVDKPLYLARAHPGLADQWHPSTDGPLIALQPNPAFDLPPDASPLDLQLGDSFKLIGFSYGESELHAATVVPLTLYWRAIQKPKCDYSVSLRLFDKAGQEIFKADSQNPVLGTYPTSLWTEGEVIADYYEILLPPDLSPGSYEWGVLMYRTLPEGGWENLKVSGSDAEVALGGEVNVGP